MIIVKERSKEWNIDLDNISICGFSAGAHLAAMLGVNWNSKLLKDKFELENEIFRPKSIILGYPGIDYMVMKELNTKSKNEMDIDLFKVSNEALFGTNSPSDELRESLSITNKITNNMPPTFIWHTANDELVYAKNSLSLALALSEKNVKYELHIFEEGPHGMSLCNDITASTEEHINLECEIWFELANKWLKKL
ncbi:alpha/beta hydrolase [Clostridium sp.]|uniref:alpha/beta hydrolase n=1 Tax=Clostridium sp. TaxID=1506 RepID=UPI0025C5DB33|nr:alpha/beta hydrolase [Clostridium sp.]